MTIAQEVLAALQEAGREVGALVLTFTRPGVAENPWDAPASGQTFALTAMDEGIKEVYVSGSSATRKARMLMVDATGTAPAIGDKVAINGATPRPPAAWRFTIEWRSALELGPVLLHPMAYPARAARSGSSRGHVPAADVCGARRDDDCRL